MASIAEKFEKLSKTGILGRNTKREVKLISDRLLTEWKSRAKNPEERKAMFFGNKYSESLEIKKSDDDFTISIGPSGRIGLGAAKIIEKGRDEYDMKKSLLASPKSKIGKSGRYIIVSFKDGEKTERAENGKKTITEQHSRSFGNIFGGFFSKMKKAPKQVKTSDVEFRVVTTDSEGWFFPKITGEPIKQKSYDKVMNNYTKRMLQKAIIQDLKGALKR